MPNQSKNKDEAYIEIFSKIEKTIKFLCLLFLVAIFLLTLFLQQGRNILLLIYPICFYLLVHSNDIRENSYGRFYKPARFFLTILCLFTILNYFMYTLLEIILNVQFVNPNVSKAKSITNPIAIWILNSQTVILFIAMLTLPFISVSSNDNEKE